MGFANSFLSHQPERVAWDVGKPYLDVLEAREEGDRGDGREAYLDGMRVLRIDIAYQRELEPSGVDMGRQVRGGIVPLARHGVDTEPRCQAEAAPRRAKQRLAVLRTVALGASTR